MRRWGVGVLFILFSISLTAQDLKRRPNIAGGIGYINKEKGAYIGQNVLPTSDLLTQGFEKGDSIIQINGKRFANEVEWDEKLSSFRAGDKYEFTIKRGDKTFKRPINFTELPKENWPGIETQYVSIPVAGKKVRVIVTYPENSAAATQPALLILSGLSCSSIELAGLARESGWGLLLKDLVTKSNMITMRVEKFGVGDSEGSCASTDFNQEMEIYRTALKALFDNPKVDKNKVVLFGSSMGSMQSAILANEFPVKAVVASGTFLKSWYEHMLEIERRIMEMNGLSFSTIQSRSMKNAEFYYDVLVAGKSFKLAAQDKPQLQEVKPSEDDHLYGRPLNYYRQIQQINIPSQWEQIKVPVLLHYGTNDWIMTEEDNDMLVRLLKKSNVDVTYMKSEGMDHNYFIFPDKATAFKNYWSGKADDQISPMIIEWIRKKVE